MIPLLHFGAGLRELSVSAFVTHAPHTWLIDSTTAYSAFADVEAVVLLDVCEPTAVAGREYCAAIRTLHR